MPQPLRFQAATTEDRDFPMTVSRTAGPKRVRRLAGTAAKPQASETISPARAREPGIAHVVATSLEEEKKGLIQRIPNRGAMVRDLTPKEVTEIYAVREELEVMAARILPLPVDASDLAKLDELQSKHSAAVDAGDMLTVFYTNLHFHQTLFGLCGNACLIETIERLAQKVFGIRSYANAFPEALHSARRDHVEMVRALRAARRDDLIALTRRHLKPSPEAYIRAYERRFGNPFPGG